MAKQWSTPQSTRGRVDWAGDVLIDLNATEKEKALALTILNNWRASHSYPLQALKMTLKKRAQKCDSKAIIAQRLKRLSSIAGKLTRIRGMKLSRMQDIGGCRAVVRSARCVDRVVRMYEKSFAKNPKARAQFVKKFDYIANPKIDGYRGVHLIYKYRSRSRHRRAWNGLRIEIQVRSRLQHYWATAVETVDAFTGQGLKVSGGTGTELRDWGRLFALMSSYMALKEERPLVRNTPSGIPDLRGELSEIAKRLNAQSTLAGWSFAVRQLEEEAGEDLYLFLITLDTNRYEFDWRGFTKSEVKEAQKAYSNKEIEIQSIPGAQAVLVSVDSIDALKAAYPNYYADTGEFLDELLEAIGVTDVGQPKGEMRQHDGDGVESSQEPNRRGTGSSYPDAVDAQLVGTYPALAKAGGGYVWDDVLEYRVWCHPERGAPDIEDGSDYYRAFATYAEAVAFSDATPGAESPLALIQQVEYIAEPKPGEYRHVKEPRVTEWPVEFLRRPRRTPNTIPDFLSPNAPANRLDILNGLANQNHGAQS